MAEKIPPSSSSVEQVPPETEDIERILRGYELNPGGRFFQKISRQAWAEPDPPPATSVKKGSQPGKAKRLRLAAVIAGVVVLVFLASPFREAVAQIVSRFFKVSPSEHMVVTISLTPYPTHDPEYSFNQLFNLTIPEAESLAGFDVKTPSVLTDEWEFQGARFEEENRKVKLFYYAENPEGISTGYLFISQLQGDFENDWGLCPNGMIEEVSVNGWPAEVAHGAVWVTYDFPTPGAQREWRCETGHDLTALALRWEEREMRYEINLTHLMHLEKLDLPVLTEDLYPIWVDELVQIAESLQ